MADTTQSGGLPKPEEGSDLVGGQSKAKRLKTLWIRRIKAEERAHKDYRKQAEKAWAHYRQQKPKEGEMPKVNYPIFWSSVNAVHASVFARMPKPDVRRRWADGSGLDGLSKVLERAITYSLDTEDFSSHAHQSVDDYLAAGLGVAKVELHTETVDEPVVNPMTGEELLDEAGKPLIQTVVTKQAVRLRHFPYCKFRWEPGKAWEFVDWVSYDHRMTATEVKKQFGVSLKSSEAKEAFDHKDKYRQEYDVHEIWDRAKRQQLFICEEHDEPLQVKDDPLGLENFYPSPAPMLANIDSDDLIPKPDYCYIEYQLRLIEVLTERITALTREIKDVGVHDASLGEELALIKSAVDGQSFPVKGLLERVNTTGRATFDAVIAKQDNSTAVNVLQTLIQIREGVRQEIERYFGVSDIQLGQTDPNETAKAQQIKAQWGNVRISGKTAEISQFFRDVFRIMAEIMAEHFDPEQLSQMTGTQIDPQMQQAMRDDLRRCYAVDIETDSTLANEDADERGQIMEMANTLTGFIGQVMPMVQQGIMPADLGKALITMITQSFKKGVEVEDAVAAMPNSMQQMQQMQQQIQQLTQQLQQAQQQGQQMQGQLQQVNERKEQREDIKTQADVMDKQASAEGKRAEAIKDMATAQDINYPGPQINSIPQ